MYGGVGALAVWNAQLQPIRVCGLKDVSFFSGLGKATFLHYFFQYASFITAGSSHHPTTAGTLADTDLDSNYELGYLAFLRLGCFHGVIMMSFV